MRPDQEVGSVRLSLFVGKPLFAGHAHALARRLAVRAPRAIADRRHADHGGENAEEDGGRAREDGGHARDCEVRGVSDGVAAG